MTSSVRKFERLNHPEVADDGVQYYVVFRVMEHTQLKYLRVADDLTLEESEQYVIEHGVWNE